MIELEFPWPPRSLSPNARCHWAAKARAAKKYKADCLLMCRCAFGTSRSEFHQSTLAGKSTLALTVSFNPPDNRRRDGDNCLASSKQIFDAISDFTGIDDSKFTIQFSKAEPVKHGAVRVSIS